ncbi:MAG: FemAB family PEP-CTERM system-associated protein [Burkholderiaceae bacterium]
MITNDIRPGPPMVGTGHGQAAQEAACASAPDDGSAAAAPITVRRRIADDFAAWQALCLERADSHFFHRAEWPDLLSRTLGYHDESLVALAQGRLVGVLPLMSVRGLLGARHLCSLPFCAYGGPLAQTEAIAQALIEAACERARELGAGHLELRGERRHCPQAPVQSLYSTFRAPIPDELDSMMGIPQKRRNVVRKAVSLGLHADVNRDADRFFEQYAENAHAHGTPALGRRFFHELLAAFPDSADVLTVRDAQGQDLSAILNFYHRGEVLAYFAGEVLAARQTNANDFKYWSLMRHARDRGCTRFDFGRSKAGTGSFKFKKLWGFEPSPLAYEFPWLPGGEVPQTNPLNPKYRLAIQVWQRLPRPIVDRIGPWVVAGLG